MRFHLPESPKNLLSYNSISYLALGGLVVGFISACSTVRPDRDVAALNRNPYSGAVRVMHNGVVDGAFPGGVAVVAHKGRRAFASNAGWYGIDDRRPVDQETVYDLASLTKVVAMTTGVMFLVADGSLDLDAPVVRYLPDFGQSGKDAITVRQLLTHSSGMPSWRPLFRETETRFQAIDSLMATRPRHPPGEHYEYSDLGAMTLGLIVERVSGSPLDELLERHVFGPLGMRSTRFLPPAEWIDRVAPTEDDPWRGQIVRGEVHDENASRLEGVSGHAGLFSTASDLARFAFWMIDAYHGRLPRDHPAYLPSKIVRMFVARQDGPEGSTRALGWDTPSPTGSTAGELMSRQSFGHTGFTGTSIWIDPEAELAVILLTNRVHPTRESQLIRQVRGPLADSVYVATTPSRR